MGYIVLTLTASYSARNQGHIFPYSTTNAHFPRLLPVPYQSINYIAFGTGYMFSRVCHRLHVFLRSPLVMFSRAFCFAFWLVNALFTVVITLMKLLSCDNAANFHSLPLSKEQLAFLYFIQNQLIRNQLFLSRWLKADPFWHLRQQFALAVSKLLRVE